MYRVTIFTATASFVIFLSASRVWAEAKFYTDHHTPISVEPI